MNRLADKLVKGVTGQMLQITCVLFPGISHSCTKNYVRLYKIIRILNYIWIWISKIIATRCDSEMFQIMLEVVTTVNILN